MRVILTLAVAVSAAASGCAGIVRPTETSTPRVQAEEVTADASPAPDAAAGTSTVPVPRDDVAETADGIVHIVQAGQTLWRVARAYGVPLNTLAEVNGIDDPSRVAVGTPVFVPGARATIIVAPYPAPPPTARLGPDLRPGPSADFLWPVDGGQFMRPFGEPRRHHTHAGVDIRGTRGQDILAAKDGVVAFCGPTKTGYGTMVVIDHGEGVQTLYAHAQKVLINSGDAVHRGQPIALLGRTGNATTEHCHFEIRLENRAVDPMTYLLGTTEARR
jgi:murein DD-endopeptidase MepM/ murein hydrolase activator NlpD